MTESSRSPNDKMHRRDLLSRLVTFAVVLSAGQTAKASSDVEPSNDGECGAYPELEPDVDCTVDNSPDNDCGIVYDHPFRYSDEDCQPGLPKSLDGERDNDCGLFRDVPKLRYDDSDCGIAQDDDWETRDSDCGRKKDAEGGVWSDSDCGNNASLGIYNRDDDCTVPGEDADCGSRGQAVGGDLGIHNDGDNGITLP